ncbi:uncharacterized protein B0I36DRAFT_57737 [Microdochium trichocladiopsis]|uniref:Uncharacterized protein n=1 Tax=Microdochium trichocladiopsis TaxID=1682393 RepID=A0A9P9BF67_9PEZI|nr:uncharacterized protein B0I36DRAFT_57737 [Microdochium trichocladiopsis]KAH7010620.1 hypothetical protein B0I36DRAFT_57737 [Microdochium trichocladiopsis]
MQPHDPSRERPSMAVGAGIVDMESVLPRRWLNRAQTPARVAVLAGSSSWGSSAEANNIFVWRGKSNGRSDDDRRGCRQGMDGDLPLVQANNTSIGRPAKLDGLRRSSCPRRNEETKAEVKPEAPGRECTKSSLLPEAERQQQAAPILISSRTNSIQRSSADLSKGIGIHSFRSSGCTGHGHAALPRLRSDPSFAWPPSWHKRFACLATVAAYCTFRPTSHRRWSPSFSATPSCSFKCAISAATEDPIPSSGISVACLYGASTSSINP